MDSSTVRNITNQFQITNSIKYCIRQLFDVLKGFIGSQNYRTFCTLLILYNFLPFFMHGKFYHVLLYWMFIQMFFMWIGNVFFFNHRDFTIMTILEDWSRNFLKYFSFHLKLCMNNFQFHTMAKMNNENVRYKKSSNKICISLKSLKFKVFSAVFRSYSWLVLQIFFIYLMTQFFMSRLHASVHYQWFICAFFEIGNYINWNVYIFVQNHDKSQHSNCIHYWFYVSSIYVYEFCTKMFIFECFL